MTDPVRDMAPATPVERVRRFLAAARRRRLAAILVAGLTVVAALGFTALRPAQYEASVQILLQPTDAIQSIIDPGGVASPANAERDVNTYTNIITVDPVVDAVRLQLGLRTSLADIAARIRVTGQSTSNLVSISARDASPEMAAALASTFATTYRSYRQQTAIAALEAAIAAADAGSGPVPSAALTQRLAQLRAASAVETGGVQIVHLASAASARATTGWGSVVLVTGIVALVLAVVTVLALESVDRRLVDDRDFEAAFGAPVIARFPRPEPSPRGEAARQRLYADLAARLSFSTLGGRRTIMIAPAAEGEVAGPVALELTAALAALGRSVVLIEADIGEASNDVADPWETGGLTSILAGTRSFETALTTMRRLTGPGERRDASPSTTAAVVPAGKPVGNPGPLLAGPAMRDVVEHARARFETVLIQAAPLDQPGSTFALAHLCDAVIVVARPRSMPVRRVGELLRLVATMVTPIIGVVLDEAVAATMAVVPSARLGAEDHRLPDPATGRSEELSGHGLNGARRTSLTWGTVGGSIPAQPPAR